MLPCERRAIYMIQLILPVSGLYYTDPVQHLLTAGWGLHDGLDHDLSEV